MPVWNTLVPVVELVAAATGEEAIAILKARVDAAGLTVHDGYPGCDVFLSEDDAEPGST